MSHYLVNDREQVATFIDKLIAAVKRNAQSTSHADRLAGSASAITGQGGRAVALEQISQAVVHMEQDTQENAALLMHAAHTAEPCSGSLNLPEQ